MTSLYNNNFRDSVKEKNHIYRIFFQIKKPLLLAGANFMLF